MNAMRPLPNISEDMLRAIIVLRSQVELARMNLLLYRGQLHQFRNAFHMKVFPEVVGLVRQIGRFNIFSTLQEIEHMEAAISSHDRISFTVQCCGILQLCESIHIREGMFEDARREHAWLFAPHKSLEEIAYLRSRLHFVPYSSYVWTAIRYSMICAADNCFRNPENPPTWQGMLLIFKEWGPFHSYRLLAPLICVLESTTGGMPKEAATLFLSFAADAISFFKTYIGDGLSAERVGLIERLLQLGASPMISREHHHNLFKLLGDNLHPGRPPWWTAPEYLTTSSQECFPTALNRLLGYDSDAEFLEMLTEYTCCSLDATESSKDNYKSKKVPTLCCLAAQKLRKFDLDKLSPARKFIAAKHQPHSFKQYSREI